MTPRQLRYICTHLMLSIALIAAPAHAGVYKWTDENGQVHYGERPTTADAERVDIIRRPFPKQVSRNGNDQPEQGSTDEEKPEQPVGEGVTEEWVQAPLTPAQRRLLCRESRDRLTTIESRGRLRANDDSRRILSPKERQQLIREVRKDIREYCR